MKIAVTGANGFVGQYLVNQLLADGNQVLAIAWDQDPFRDSYESDPCLQRHLTDFSREDLSKTMSGVDVIVHLSAMRTNAPSDALGIHPYFEANVRSTENIIKAALDCSVQRICQASSIAVYSPENTVPYREDQYPVPLSLYAVSKLMCENLAAIYARQSSIKIISLRFAQIFGYGELRGLAFTKFIDLACSKQPIPVWGEGRSARDYIYVKDVIDSIIYSIKADTNSGPINIGSGTAYSVREIAETINSVFQNPSPIVYDMSKQERVEISYMDNSLAFNKLGWQPKWSLIRAIEDIHDCYAKEKTI